MYFTVLHLIKVNVCSKQKQYIIFKVLIAVTIMRVAQKALQHFLYFSQIQQKSQQLILWLIFKVLIATVVPWSKTFSCPCSGSH